MRLSTIIPLALLCAACSAHVGESPAERSFKAQLGLEKYPQVEYRDAHGAAISFEQFQKLQPSFPSFSMQKSGEGERKSAVVSLQEAAAEPSSGQYKLKPGDTFPVFKQKASDDSIVDSSALRGHYTLISFYFAECAPCVKEVPMLNAFAARHKEIKTLAVTFDSAEVTREFARKTRFSWPTLADGKALIDQVGVLGYPAFALVDPKGALVAIGNQSEIGGNIDNWVSGATPPLSR